MLKPQTPSSAERFGGDPGISNVRKATPEQRAAAVKRAAELDAEEKAITDAQRDQGIGNISNE